MDAVPSDDDARRAAQGLPGSVRVFGGVATGGATADSNIDLLVVLDNVNRERGEVPQLQNRLVDTARQNSDHPVRVVAVDWPEWLSRRRVPGRVEHSAQTRGKWLKKTSPGPGVEWDRVTSPQQETTHWIAYALTVAARRLDWTGGRLRPDWDTRPHPFDKSGPEDGYWRRHRNRLFEVHSLLYVAVDQLADATNYLQGVPYENQPGTRLRSALERLSALEDGQDWFEQWHTSSYDQALRLATRSDIADRLEGLVPDPEDYICSVLPEAAGVAAYAGYALSMADALRHVIDEETSKDPALIVNTGELREATEALTTQTVLVREQLSARHWVYPDGSAPPNGWPLPLPLSPDGYDRWVADSWDQEGCGCSLAARCGLLSAAV